MLKYISSELFVHKHFKIVNILIYYSYLFGEDKQLNAQGKSNIKFANF